MPGMAYIMCTTKSILNLNICVMTDELTYTHKRNAQIAIDSSIRALCDIDLVSEHSQFRINTHSIRCVARLARTYFVCCYSMTFSVSTQFVVLGIPEMFDIDFNA